MMQFQMGGSSSKKFEVEKQTATQNVESFDLKQYRKQCLEEINKYRSRHGVSAMVMDEEINRYAQDWADYLAKGSMFEHRKEHKYGENLGAVSSIQRQNVIEMWYNEYDKYRFSHQGFASGTGHFTQIVWKASKKLGIGVAFDKKRNMWIVCGNFDPPGNVLGQFEANVFDRK